MAHAVTLIRRDGAGFELGAATRLEQASAPVTGAGRHLSNDLKPRRDNPSAAGTHAVAEAVAMACRDGAAARV